MRIERARPGTPLYEEVATWCREHFEQSLLLAGDMTDPLVPLSEVVAATRRGLVVGGACRFSGFAVPSSTASAADEEAVHRLLQALDVRAGLLAVSSRQPLPDAYKSLNWSEDPWLVSACERDDSQEAAVEAVRDRGELEAFYRRVGSTYWSPAMFEMGNAFASRAQGEIVGAVSVQFTLRWSSYAHIGALATDAAHRGRGVATALLRALRSALANRGILRCGVFADASRPWLVDFYRARGFTSDFGSYRFAPLAC
jgi:ribosomal protein S18 acetylase RimI-like enzyme